MNNRQLRNYFEHTVITDEWYWNADPEKLEKMDALVVAPIVQDNAAELDFIHNPSCLPRNVVEELYARSVEAWKERRFIDTDYNWKEELNRLAKFSYKGLVYWIRFVLVEKSKNRQNKIIYERDGQFLYAPSIDKSDFHEQLFIQDFKTHQFLNAPLKFKSLSFGYFIRVRGKNLKLILKNFYAKNDDNLKQQFFAADIGYSKILYRYPLTVGGRISAKWWLLWFVINENRKNKYKLSRQKAVSSPLLPTIRRIERLWMALKTTLISTVILATALFVYFWATKTNNDESEKSKSKAGRIAEVSPTIPIRQEEPEPLVETNKVSDFCYGKNGKVQVDEEGTKWFNGAPIYDEQPGDAFLNGEKISKPKIFMYRSERLIADLLRHPPGMPIPAAPNYAIDWDQDFADSLLHHIEILPTDSQEVRQLKRDVIDTKKEIVAMIKDGGSFSEVIAATQKEANKLAGTRNEMLRIYNEMKRDGASAKELKDHLDAANILLERKGSIPLPISRKLLIQLEDDEN